MNNSAVSSGAWEAAKPDGLYLFLVLSRQPTPLAGAHFHASILAHYLPASWRPFLQAGKEGSGNLPQPSSEIKRHPLSSLIFLNVGQ